jgi:hypothetical protein
MTWYRDLEPGDYFGRAYREALAVGWLGQDKPYRTGSVDGSILDRLETIRALGFDIVRRACGFHERELCLAAGRRGVLGNASVWVPGDGTVFVSPEMVTHYIQEHGTGGGPAGRSSRRRGGSTDGPGSFPLSHGSMLSIVDGDVVGSTVECWHRFGLERWSG